MYQIKELFFAAFQNQRRRKKYTRTVFFLMFLSMVICIGVNSIVISIDGSIRNVTDKPLGKLLQIIDNTEDNSMINVLREELGGLDRIGSIGRLIPFLEVTWYDTEDILYSETVNVDVVAYFSGMDEYGISGKYSDIAYGEVLIPEYLYGLGDYGLYEYTSGSLLIGKEIEISIHNNNNEKDYYHTLRIVGTYDNINSGCINKFFFINDLQADEIYTQTNEDIEIDIEKVKELFKEELKKDPNMIDEDNYYTKHYIGVYVKNRSDVKEMQELIDETINQPTFIMQVPDESLLQYFRMILDICQIVVLMLLAVAFASLVITTLTEIKQRNGEIAVYFAMGYSYKSIILMLALEKAIMLFWAGMVAFLFTGAAILGGNYFIQTCLPFYRRTIVLSYDWSMVGIAFLVLAAAALVSLFFTAVHIRKFHLADVMKSEWAKM
jgi:ABC-type antimicrobial peptide transport system, permease component